jgi:hypothetical protein
MKAMEMPPVITVIRSCPRCKGISEIRVVEDHLKRWQQGELIQKAIPEMPVIERETLISGYCRACQHAIFDDAVEG